MEPTDIEGRLDRDDWAMASFLLHNQQIRPAQFERLAWREGWRIPDWWESASRGQQGHWMQQRIAEARRHGQGWALEDGPDAPPKVPRSSTTAPPDQSTAVAREWRTASWRDESAMDTGSVAVVCVRADAPASSNTERAASAFAAGREASGPSRYAANGPITTIPETGASTAGVAVLSESAGASTGGRRHAHRKGAGCYTRRAVAYIIRTFQASRAAGEEWHFLSRLHFSDELIDIAALELYRRGDIAGSQFLVPGSRVSDIAERAAEASAADSD